MRNLNAFIKVHHTKIAVSIFDYLKRSRTISYSISLYLYSFKNLEKVVSRWYVYLLILLLFLLIIIICLPPYLLLWVRYYYRLDNIF